MQIDIWTNKESDKPKDYQIFVKHLMEQLIANLEKKLPFNCVSMKSTVWRSYIFSKLIAAWNQKSSISQIAMTTDMKL